MIFHDILQLVYVATVKALSVIVLLKKATQKEIDASTTCIVRLPAHDAGTNAKLDQTCVAYDTLLPY